MYKVKQEDNQFLAVEVSTELVIKTFADKKECKSFCDQLNKGRGFRGFTPPFFVKNVA